MDPSMYQWMMNLSPEQLEALRAQTQTQQPQFQSMGSQFPPFRTQFSSPQSAFQLTHSQTPSSQFHSSVGEQEEVEDEDNVAQDSAISPNKKGSKTTFTPEEDEALVKAYMESSVDAVNGTNQELGTFWATVVDKYNEYRQGREATMPKRIINSLKGRWARVQKDVQQWVGCLRIASKRAEQSGYNGEEDMLKECHRIFLQDNKKRFLYEHVYRNLRTFPKWEIIISLSVTELFKGGEISTRGVQINSQSSGSGKRSRDQIDVDEDIEAPASSRKRPIGNKAAKKASKGKNIATPGVDKLTSTLDTLNTNADRHLAVQEKRAEAEILKAQAKLATSQQLDRAWRAQVLMQLNQKPHLDERDQQARLKLMEELGL